MNEQKHTPLPWKTVPFDGQGETASGQVQRVSPDNAIYNVAIFRKLEDAQLCSDACNSHYKLLEACQKALAALETCNDMAEQGLRDVGEGDNVSYETAFGIEFDDDAVEKAKEALQAAIAAAKGASHEQTNTNGVGA